jgi:hypothetical protein
MPASLLYAGLSIIPMPYRNLSLFASFIAESALMNAKNTGIPKN